MFIRSRGSLENPTRLKTIMVKIYTRFQTKMAQKPALWDGTYLYSLYKYNSLYCGHPRDRVLCSLLAKVRDSGNLFQSNICNLFFSGGLSCSRYYLGVRNGEVSAKKSRLSRLTIV